MLTTSGVPDAERQRMSADLGIDVRENEEHLVDPEAVGLATQGPVLTEFTPPEEVKSYAPVPLYNRFIDIVRAVRALRRSIA